MMREKAKYFPTGRLLCTPNAKNVVGVDEMMAAFYRHRQGDWGEVGPEDWLSNDQAVRRGARVFSVYCSRRGQKFWIITEADRSATTILLPEDY